MSNNLRADVPVVVPDKCKKGFKTIVKGTNLGENYTTFQQILKLTGLSKDLKKFRGTVFAPSNKAFDAILTKKLKIETLEKVKKNRPEVIPVLRDIALAHFYFGDALELSTISTEEAGRWG